MDKPDWTLVANASRARLFRQQGEGSFVPVASFEHPESRLRSSTLADDKAGRELSGRGFGSAAFEPRIAAQRKAHRHFAQQLSEFLEAGAREGSYAAIRVFASSPFLGELKQSLGASTKRLLVATRDVDLTHVGLAEMAGRIRHELAHPHAGGDAR